MNDDIAQLPVAEMCSEVTHERINPDALDGLGVTVLGIELAAALRVSQIPPVGGVVAGAGEARLLDEGFQQDRAIRVARVPVLSQASTDQGERPRSQVFA